MTPASSGWTPEHAVVIARSAPARDHADRDSWSGGTPGADRSGSGGSELSRPRSGGPAPAGWSAAGWDVPDAAALPVGGVIDRAAGGVFDRAAAGASAHPGEAAPGLGFAGGPPDLAVGDNFGVPADVDPSRGVGNRRPPRGVRPAPWRTDEAQQAALPPLLSVPQSLRGALAVPARRAVLGVLALVLLAGCVVAGRVVLARSSSGGHQIAQDSYQTRSPTKGPTGSQAARSQARPAAGAASSGLGSPGRFATPSAGAQTPASSAAVVIVDVVGAVRRPGVVQLKAGQRIQDAVAAAGGADAVADLTAINLAGILADGQQIVVPKKGQAPPIPVTTAPSSGSSSAMAPVDVNTADAGGLDTLPGVGPVLAQRIIDFRTAHGPFRSIDELGEVSGIGEKVLADLRPLVLL